MNRTILTRMATGALAGAVGVWALDRVTWWMYDREDPAALDREMRARPDGLDPAHVVAHRTARLLGRDHPPQQPTPGGMAVHYALGVVPGAAYALLRHKGLDRGRGVLFGVALFVLQDELVNWAIGTSGRPTEYPWQAHVRGLVGHAVYGAVMDGTLRTLDRVS